MNFRTKCCVLPQCDTCLNDADFQGLRLLTHINKVILQGENFVKLSRDRKSTVNQQIRVLNY